MELLPIGSMVRLNNGKRKLMIISRTPLTVEDGVTGYYDYGACLYPDGQVNQTMFFFNSEDIAEICCKGYCDELELQFREKYEEAIGKITYPKFTVKKETQA